MNTIIDWLSFTVPIRSGVENLEGFALAVENGLHDMFGAHIVKQVFGGKWDERKNGRAPYSSSYDVAQTGIVVFVNPKIDNILVEISGQGCVHLRNMGLQSGVLEMAQLRLTRIDLAVDMETQATPSEFAPKAQYASFASYSEIRSKTGQTVYIGSASSERYTRVYRYASPHPRHRYLRVEFVFRRKVARAVASEILVQGEMAIAAHYGKKANFLHPSWLPTDSADSFTATTHATRSSQKTLTWFIQTCVPVFRRLVREGTIPDAATFIDNHLLHQ